MSSFRIYFVHPWLLLFIIPLVLITLWPVFRLPKVRRFTWNRKLSLALHSLIIVLLVALLADMTVYRDRDEVNTVLLVDYSASTEDSYSAIDAYVKEIAASAGEKNRISVVAYGKDVLSLTEFYEEEAELLEAVQNR